MLKRIIGAFSIIYGAIMMWGGYMDKNQSSDISIAPLMIVTGIFLVVFDNVHKKSYIDGFITRNAQRVVMILLMIIWITLFAITLLGFLALALAGDFAFSAEYIIACVSVVVALVPGFTIMWLFKKYSKPYKVCKNSFLTTDGEIAHYLSNKKAFTVYSKNKFVIASDKALFFPELFCLVPFKQIKSVTNKSTISGKAVEFVLKNGEKFKVYTKQYDDIMKAINANK